MKKIYTLLTLLLIIILIILLIPHIMNEIVISNYNDGKYNHKLIESLKSINYKEKYVVYYNEGNILNQEKKYDEAIQSYEMALTKKPPITKKCQIRVNMSITMIQNIKSKKKKDVLEALEKAKQNLYEDHCADEEDQSGESQDAEELEEEINEQIEEIQKQQSSGEGKDEEELEEPSEGEGEETEEEQNIQQELQQINRDANQSRQRDLQEYGNLGKYQYYSGKNW